MAVTRNGRDPRLEFILGILEISLSLFKLSIEFDKRNKEYKVYYNININNEDYKFYITNNLKNLFEFCDLRTLYNRHDYFNDNVIFDLLSRHKYYNQNLVLKVKSYKDIKNKFDLQETSKLFMKFHKYIRGINTINNYIFTSYDSIYIKSIDNFFETELEKGISDVIKDEIGDKYNKDIVTQILTYYNGSTPTEREVQDLMKGYKESIEKFGDFYEFLLNSSKDEVVSDIANYLSELKLEEFDNSV